MRGGDDSLVFIKGNNQPFRDKTEEAEGRFVSPEVLAHKGMKMNT